MIVVTPYNDAWPAWFEQVKARVWPALRDVALGIEHVGSTSVPGLAAKPIIDIDIIVPDAAAMATVIARLEGLGYEHRGDLGIAGREAFAAPPLPALPRHHLYACVRGCTALRNHLALRDHLRAHPDEARAYGELKQRLAIAHAHDIDAYIAGKTQWIVAVLARCGLTSAELIAIGAANTPDEPRP
jgi:GrpB-like predicted nucleotidyltransferase (UPF0157 family)